MRLTSQIALSAFAAVMVVGPAHAATTVTDAVGDFLPSFVGTQDADLDVTSFSVDFDSGLGRFTLGAVFAGVINPANAGRYVIGVNTGAGASAPFGAIGAPNVRFDQTISITKLGVATIGATTLPSSAVTVIGNQFIAFIPLNLLPSTGAQAGFYGFNLWPRNGGAGTAAISDFAPNNAMIAAIPEPATWGLMLAGFGVTGLALRSRRQRVMRLA